MHHGLLPGDFSYTFTKGDLRLGIAGLNSTFLQLTQRPDYQGRLVVDPRQFHEACGGDGPKWTESHHACLLMTHHPPKWLSEQSRDYLNGEILESFCLHLCGHNHLTDVLQILSGGTAEAPIQWLGRSLFGLEKADDGKVDRSHGYAAGELRVEDDQACLQFMPRKYVQAGTTWDLVPDQSVKLPIANERTREFPIKLRDHGETSQHEQAAGPETEPHDARFIMHEALESVCTALNSGREPFTSMRTVISSMEDDSVTEVTVQFLEAVLQNRLMDLMHHLRCWLDEAAELKGAGRVREIIDVFSVAGLNREWVDRIIKRLEQAHIEVPLWTDIHLCEPILTALFQKAVGSWIHQRWIRPTDVEPASTEPEARRYDIRKSVAERRMGQILPRGAGESQEKYEARYQEYIKTRLPRALKVDREDGKPFFFI